jgi:hypothetical protein
LFCNKRTTDTTRIRTIHTRKVNEASVAEAESISKPGDSGPKLTVTIDISQERTKKGNTTVKDRKAIKDFKCRFLFKELLD